MKILVTLNIALMLLVAILVAYIFTNVDSDSYRPQLISLESLFEQKISYGEDFTVYGYLVRGDGFSFLYPNKNISEMQGMYANWLEAIIWFDPEATNPECFDAFVTVSGKAVPYFGWSLGFDELSDFSNMETDASCMPEGTPRFANYFHTFMQDQE